MRYGFICYLVFINLIAIILTIRDKHTAQQHRWRVPEATLLWVSILGGSLGMYTTMRLIHHKTQHRKFMWGIPAIFVGQLVIFFLVIRYVPFY
ncbi:MAG: DUF1294 domain-containing protein [Anaeromassilibacillus sp.]